MRDLNEETDDLKGLKTRKGAEDRLALVADVQPESQTSSAPLGFAFQRKDGMWIPVVILGASQMWRALAYAQAGCFVTNCL